MIAGMDDDRESGGPMSARPVGFDYAALLRGSLVGMVRELIERVAREGFPGDHHFLLTFGTHEPGVVMSPRLRQRYPEEMTIVLQHQFWDLGTDGDAFWVTLRFAGSPEPLTVPWAALRGFADPSADFGLRFQAPPDAASEPSAPEPGEEEPRSDVSAAKSDPSEPAPKVADNVIDFGAHRRRGGGEA
jgi:hypothetical protein